MFFIEVFLGESSFSLKKKKKTLQMIFQFYKWFFMFFKFIKHLIFFFKNTKSSFGSNFKNHF